jgi:hypothetical protein
MSSNQIRRPAFYEGQFLGAADLTTAVDYARVEDARHLLGAHTWGIAGGLEITEKDSAAGGGQVDVFIQPGYAWDGFGRPIVMLTPTKIPAELFKSILFDAGQDNQTPPGRLVQVWLRYDETATQSPGPGFQQCGAGDQFARIGETFRLEIGEQQAHASHAPISVAGYTADAQDMLQLLDPHDPPVQLFDESIPYQDFPTDNPRARWMIPLGEVRWLPNTLSNQPGTFVKRVAADLLHSRSLRRQIGVVAGAVEAAAGFVRMHDRTRPYSTVATPELVWVEGDLRVEGDARLFKGKLEFRDQNGINNNDDRLMFSRRDAPGASSLQAVIGKGNSGANTFVVGPIDNSGNIVPKLTVRDNATVGIGTDAPDRNLTIQGTSASYLNLKTGDGKEVLFGADTNGGIVSTMSNHDLHLRAGSNIDRLIIKADGKVGIGTATPVGGLTVQGSGQQGALTLFSANSDFEYDGGSDGLFIFRDNGGRTAFMGGNVGIGTPTPYARLTIEGSIGFTNDTSPLMYIYQSGANNPTRPIFAHSPDFPDWGLFYNDSKDVMVFQSETGPTLSVDTARKEVHISGSLTVDDTPSHSVMVVDIAGKAVRISGDLIVDGNASKSGGGEWGDSSDLRLKKNIEPLTGALNKLLQLRGVRFEWIDPDKMGNRDGQQIGMVAQEVEQIFPEWISSRSDGYKEITKRGFDALIVEALRELEMKIEDLKRRLQLPEA